MTSTAMVTIEIILSLLLIVSALAVTAARDRLAVVILLSVYSAVLAMLFATLGAGDVAFTEAVVGTGVSTVFLMALMRRVDTREGAHRRRPRRVVAMAACLALGAAMLYGVSALPDFGSPTAPATQHVSPYYVTHSVEDMDTPNVVTAVLGDYRGFDTLIESAVVLTAALACLLVSRRRP